MEGMAGAAGGAAGVAGGTAAASAGAGEGEGVDAHATPARVASDAIDARDAMRRLFMDAIIAAALVSQQHSPRRRPRLPSSRLRPPSHLGANQGADALAQPLTQRTAPPLLQRVAPRLADVRLDDLGLRGRQRGVEHVEV